MSRSSGQGQGHRNNIGYTSVITHICGWPGRLWLKGNLYQSVKSIFQQLGVSWDGHWRWLGSWTQWAVDTLVLNVWLYSDISSPQLCQLCCIRGNRCQPLIAATGKPTTLGDGMACKYGACQQVRTRVVACVIHRGLWQSMDMSLTVSLFTAILGCILLIVDKPCRTPRTIIAGQHICCVASRCLSDKGCRVGHRDVKRRSNNAKEAVFLSQISSGLLKCYGQIFNNFLEEIGVETRQSTVHGGARRGLGG